jgi:hypothetical protein
MSKRFERWSKTRLLERDACAVFMREAVYGDRYYFISLLLKRF